MAETGIAATAHSEERTRPRILRNVFSNWTCYAVSLAVNFFLSPFGGERRCLKHQKGCAGELSVRNGGHVANPRYLHDSRRHFHRPVDGISVRPDLWTHLEDSCAPYVLLRRDIPGRRDHARGRQAQASGSGTRSRGHCESGLEHSLG